MEVVDFLQLDEGGKGRLYIRNPRDTYDWEVYTKPLLKVTWVAVIAYVIMVPMVMVIVMVNCKYSLILAVVCTRGEVCRSK